MWEALDIEMSLAQSTGPGWLETLTSTAQIKARAWAEIRKDQQLGYYLRSVGPASPTEVWAILQLLVRSYWVPVVNVVSRSIIGKDVFQEAAPSSPPEEALHRRVPSKGKGWWEYVETPKDGKPLP